MTLIINRQMHGWFYTQSKDTKTSSQGNFLTRFCFLLNKVLIFKNRTAEMIEEIMSWNAPNIAERSIFAGTCILSLNL